MYTTGPWLTIDIYKAVAVADETFRSPQQIVETDTEANLLDHLVGILGVDVVFDRMDTPLGEVIWIDPNQVGNFGLRLLSKNLFSLDKSLYTKPQVFNREYGYQRRGWDEDD